MTAEELLAIVYPGISAHIVKVYPGQTFIILGEDTKRELTRYIRSGHGMFYSIYSAYFETENMIVYHSFISQAEA